MKIFLMRMHFDVLHLKGGDNMKKVMALVLAVSMAFGFVAASSTNTIVAPQVDPGGGR